MQPSAAVTATGACDQAEAAEHEEARELVTKVLECKGSNLWVEGKAHLTELPHSVGSLVWLRSLFARNNTNMTSLSHRLSNLECLVMLDVGNCALESLPDDLGRLKQLRTMILSRNRIRNLPHDFGGLVSLEHLLLNDNQLCYAPESAKALFQRLKVLNLEANPLATPSTGCTPECSDLEAATTTCTCGNALPPAPVPYVFFTFPVGEWVGCGEDAASDTPCENTAAATAYHAGALGLPAGRRYIPYATFLCSLECVVRTHRAAYVRRVVPGLQKALQGSSAAASDSMGVVAVAAGT